MKEYVLIDIKRESKRFSRKFKTKKKCRGFVRLLKRYVSDTHLYIGPVSSSILELLEKIEDVMTVMEFLINKGVLDKVKWYPEELLRIRRKVLSFAKISRLVLVEKLVESILKYRDNRIIEFYKENPEELSLEILEGGKFDIDDVLSVYDEILSLDNILLYENLMNSIIDGDLSINEAKEIINNKR